MRRLSRFETSLRSVLCSAYGCAPPPDPGAGPAVFLIDSINGKPLPVSAELHIFRSGEEKLSDLLAFMHRVSSGSANAQLYVVADNDAPLATVLSSLIWTLRGIQCGSIGISAGQARMSRIMKDGSEVSLDPLDHMAEFPKDRFCGSRFHLRRGQVVSVNCRTLTIRSGATEYVAKPNSFGKQRQRWLRMRREGRLVSFLPIVLKTGERLAIAVRSLGKRGRPNRLEGAV